MSNIKPLPLKLKKVAGRKFKITDETDYTASSYPFDFNAYLGSGGVDVYDGSVRILKVEGPDGYVKYYCQKTDININDEPTTPFIDLNVEFLETDITSLNNKEANWDIPAPKAGRYNVTMLVVPAQYFLIFPENVYVNGDYCTRMQNFKYVLYQAYHYTPVPPETGFTFRLGEYGYDLSFYPYNFPQFPEQPDQLIQYKCFGSIDIDYTFEDALDCIYGKAKNAFCKGCKCSDICKNKNYQAIVKANCLLAELAILEAYASNENATQEQIDEYNAKLEEYTKVLVKICKCSCKCQK